MTFGKVVLIAAILLLIAALAYFIITKYVDTSRFKLDIGGSAPRAQGGNDNTPDKGFKGRLRGLGVFTGSIIAILFARLWSMQLVSNEEFSKKAELNRTRTIRTAAPRGRILDRKGVALVDNRPCLTVTAMPEVVDNLVEIHLLANLLGMPAMAVRRKIQDQSEGAQSARTVAIDVPRRVVAYIGEHADVFEGVDIAERTQRNYPYGSLAAHVLGYTGPATKEQIEASKASTEGTTPYALGDIIGQAGVELEYESVLQGISGEQTVYVDADGRVTDYSTSVPAESGSDVVLTIDKDIQQAAEEGLLHGISQAHKQGYTQCMSGCAIVLDATDGSCLACASEPTFYPGLFVGGISNQDWEKLSSKSAGYPLMNKAISGQFMAASTIKPLSVFAAMDFGIAGENSGYNCTGFWTGMGKAYGKYCWKHEGHGHMTLQSGITYSCDTVFYEIAKSFFNSEHKEGLQETYRRWGLGKKTGIDLPGEATGLIPDAKWKWNHFSSSKDADRQWQGGDTANIVIGQGDLTVTCIQMAEVYMGIANRGKMWRPHVLHAIRSHASDGSVIDYKPEVYLDPKQTQKEFDLVDRGLIGVIYDETPAISNHFTNLDVKVAGKTGTGERAADSAPTGWFCCFAPVDKPKYVIAALIENGGFGSTTAMFTCRDILGQIYNKKDTASDAVENVQ